MQSFDPERFLSVRDTVLSSAHEQKGIGTLGEKSLHAILKAYYEPISAFHEQKLGRYVADILNEDGVIEIQTRGLSRMRDKLEVFLAVTPVTVVYPLVRKKTLSWIDPETGEVTAPRRSPKTGTIYDAFWELGGIPDLLSHPNLTICITMIDAEDTRLLNGWSRDRKHGSTRADRIPAALISETFLRTKNDYLALLPDTLAPVFTRKELAAAVHLTPDRASSVLRVYRALGLLAEAGKRGREKLYAAASVLPDGTLCLPKGLPAPEDAPEDLPKETPDAPEPAKRKPPKSRRKPSARRKKAVKSAPAAETPAPTAETSAEPQHPDAPADASGEPAPPAPQKKSASDAGAG